ncbi:MAG: hypothetical protein ACKVWR_11150 [Acidimicrobiales bacterium]
MCAGTTAVWVDIDRVGDGPLPDRAPLTTHLWAWTNERLLRVRIDRDRFWLTELSDGDGDEPVDVSGPTPLRPWEADRRVALQAHAARRRFDAYLAHHRPTSGPAAAPVVFYRERPE